jgi:hypothetical protein
MSRNPWASKPHRFAVEELLDHPVVGIPNSQAPSPAKAGRSIPKSNNEKTNANKAAQARQGGGRVERKKHHSYE